MPRWLLAAVLLPSLAGAGDRRDADWVVLPGSAAFASVLAWDDQRDGVTVAPFELLRTPVTNQDFLRFVLSDPDWQRGRVPALFAEARYLAHWQGPTRPGPGALPEQPVVRVSWFAADAYCRSLDARLPTWAEWEFAAAADGTRADARADPAWRERILSWYSRPSNAPLPAVAAGDADVNGVHDLNGLVWEWVDDHAALLVSADNRDQGDPDLLAFCGAGALSTDDRENYAVLMRVAMLSALRAHDVTGNLGFRCARPPPSGDRP
jgi:formylglycine-generating enzyme required for sulfatase activity